MADLRCGARTGIEVAVGVDAMKRGGARETTRDGAGRAHCCESGAVGQRIGVIATGLASRRESIVGERSSTTRQALRSESGLRLRLIAQAIDRLR